MELIFLLSKHVRRPVLASLAAAVAVVTLAMSAQSAMAASGKQVYDDWKDAKGRHVILRYGTYDTGTKKGFGWEKITKKHEIKKSSSVKFVTQAPNGGTAQGSDRLYLAYADKITCTASTCRVADETPVRVVVSFDKVDTYYGVAINDVLGVKTAYCVNDDKADDCPSWVDSALSNPTNNNSPLTSSDPTASAQPSVRWSYSSLGVGSEVSADAGA